MTRRAAVMAAGLLGAATVSAFARGEPVTLPGASCSLIVERTGPLHALGHGKMAVSVAAHDGTKLADLCVYIDQTPALDQLTAFALHTSAGIESEIIAASNIIRTYPGAEDHPALEGKKRPTSPAWFANATGGVFGNDYDRRRAMQEQYWAESQDLWMRELRAFIFGRHVKLMGALNQIREAT